MAKRNPPATDAEKQKAINLAASGLDSGEIAEMLGRADRTIRGWILGAKRNGVESGVSGETSFHEQKIVGLQDNIRELEARLKAVHRDNLTAENVRRSILGLTEQTPNPPNWLTPKARKQSSAPDVPVIMLSDFHWGEVVDPGQVNGVNEYNLAIAQSRLRAVVEKIIYLYDEHTTDHDAPGIVVFLGGDMISGDIHDELTETNELPTMPVLLDLLGCLLWALRKLADRFGRVFVAGVTGNHGRNTVKPRLKQRAYSNFDWLLYCLLEKHFDTDDRVQFFIPSSADAYVNVNGHRFLLTHGDNLGVQGGDGIIGALGPIMRGSFKTRNSQSAIGQEIDTLVIGHWHQYIPLPRVIVNGALKGFDEFAKLKLRAIPEPPIQAMWWVSRTYGIIRQDPVFADKPKAAAPGAWVAAWRDAA